MMYNCLLAVVLATATQVAALPAFFQGRHLYRGKALEELHSGVKLPDPYAKTFEQRVDHFDRSNLNTFKQRYFINDTFWRGPESNAPVFLCVGGEGNPVVLQILNLQSNKPLCLFNLIRSST